MGTSEYKREIIKRSSLIFIISQDIQKEDYSLMQKLYESACIQTKDLIANRKKTRGYNSDLSKLIFYDIRDVLIDKIIEDESISSIFVEFCSNRWPDVVTAYNNAADDSKRIMKARANLSDIKTAFFDYLCMNSPMMTKDGVDDSWVDFEDAEFRYKAHSRSYNSSIYDMWSKTMFFEDTEEFILESPLFEKHINKRYEALSEYLHVSRDKIEKTIQDSLQYLSVDMKSQALRQDYDSFTSYVSQIINRHSGSILWLHSIIGAKVPMAKSYGYRVDVDGIIREFYKLQVVAKYNEYADKEVPFTKLTLARECEEPIETEYLKIQHLCVTDVVYKLFDIVLEDYYAHFSWEQFTGQNQADRYVAIIRDLEHAISLKDEKLSGLESKIKSLEEITFKNNYEISTYHEKEKKEFQEKLEKKDDEIRSLREQIRLLEEFHYAQDMIEEDITESINPDILKTKRYLFVGHESDIMGKLKKEFPSSIFVTENTSDMSNLAVDGIVMLIATMSHSLYYKVKMSAVFREVDTVMCNSVNINNVYHDMSKGFAGLFN